MERLTLVTRLGSVYCSVSSKTEKRCYIGDSIEGVLIF